MIAEKPSVAQSIAKVIGADKREDVTGLVEATDAGREGELQRNLSIDKSGLSR